MKKFLVIVVLIFAIYTSNFAIKAEEISPNSQINFKGSYKTLYVNSKQIIVYKTTQNDTIENLKNKTISTKYLYFYNNVERAYTNIHDLGILEKINTTDNFINFEFNSEKLKYVQTIKNIKNLTNLQKLNYFIKVNESDSNELKQLKNDIDIKIENDLEVLKTKALDTIDSLKKLSYSEYQKHLTFVRKETNILKLNTYLSKIKDEDNSRIFWSWVWFSIQWGVIALIVITFVYFMFFHKFEWKQEV